MRVTPKKEQEIVQRLADNTQSKKSRDLGDTQRSIKIDQKSST